MVRISPAANVTGLAKVNVPVALAVNVIDPIDEPLFLSVNETVPVLAVLALA
jgi:hypothetical protein